MYLFPFTKATQIPIPSKLCNTLHLADRNLGGCNLMQNRSCLLYSVSSCIRMNYCTAFLIAYANTDQSFFVIRLLICRGSKTGARLTSARSGLRSSTWENNRVICMDLRSCVRVSRLCSLLLNISCRMCTGFSIKANVYDNRFFTVGS